MQEPGPSGGSAAVPAFLMKLWTLVEEPSTSDVITWSWDGQNFCILDEQRFAKELLPKYFKHNNLSSFIRQLNMYGFRKVVSLESGLLQSDRGSWIEFQHLFFKKGKAELLENIKRKMSSVKPEDPPLSHEELRKVVTELQDLKDVQSSMDTKLENMRRENKALWKEVSLLRKRHNQQQKLLSKVLQFILSLMRGNIVMAPKRKRQLSLESSPSSPPKYSRHMLQMPEGAEEEVPFSSQNPGSSTDSMMEIHEVFSPGEGTSQTSTHPAAPAQCVAVLPSTSVGADSSVQGVTDDPTLQWPSLADQNLDPSRSDAGDELALDVVQANASEDPDSAIDSILNENLAGSSADLLERDDLQDFLSCINASLEELQSMLSRKKLIVDSEVIDEDLQQNAADATAALGSDDRGNKDRQLMQYTGNPLLSLFDLPSNHSGAASLDPGALLSPLDDGLYPGSSAAQNNSSRPADLLLEDFSGSDELLPLFVLSPVNKLIDEVTDSERL